MIVWSISHCLNRSAHTWNAHRSNQRSARYWKIVLSEMHFFFLYYASRSVLGVLCARTLLQPFCGAVTKRAKCKNLERVLAPPRCKWWRLFLRPPSVLSYPPSFQSRTRLVAVLHKVPKRKDCLQTSPDTGKCLVRLWQSKLRPIARVARVH